MDTNLQLLKILLDNEVEFILVGGMAAAVHGSTIITWDMDVYAPLTDENNARIVKSLSPLDPRFRMRPDKLPLYDDPTRLRGFRNINLVTDLGVLDILGEFGPFKTYDEALRHSVMMEVEGIPLRVLDLEPLIAAKKLANREKDWPMILLLERILKERKAQR
jgi:predicted nucleotidyltransferase